MIAVSGTRAALTTSPWTTKKQQGRRPGAVAVVVVVAPRAALSAARRLVAAAAAAARRGRRLAAMAAAPPSQGQGLGEHGSWDWRKEQEQQQQEQQQEPREEDKQYAPAASRNEAPILEALTAVLRRTAAAAAAEGSPPPPGALLEVACGTGQHAAAFARALIDQGNGNNEGKPSPPPPLLSAYLPTDLTAANFASVRAHAASARGVLPPRALDASLPPERWFAENDGGDSGAPAPPPPPLPLRAILAVNLTHISPWAATTGLLRGAAAHLHPSGGRLLIYGPFTRNGGQHVGEGDGNARFDAALRAQDPAWGYRDVEDELAPAAEAAGLELEEVRPMPANNLFLVFCRRREG